MAALISTLWALVVMLRYSDSGYSDSGTPTTVTPTLVTPNPVTPNPVTPLYSGGQTPC